MPSVHKHITDTELPLKSLIKLSMRVLLYFVLVTGVMSTLELQDLSLVAVRVFFTLAVFSLVLFTNIGLMVYFEKREKTSKKKRIGKIFLTGWLITALLMISLHFGAEYLMSRGYLLELSQTGPEIFERLESWRRVLYLLFVSLILYSLIHLIQNFILNHYERVRIENELLQLKATNAETTNQLLQQQIQPHFLFNALNVLKSLIKRYPQTAEVYLLRLSDFLRASLTGSQTGLAQVREELKLCEDYMEMQKIRFGNALRYSVELTDAETCEHLKLPFFSLQPLLENAIKHNELTEENPLLITVVRKGDYIEVRNNRRPKKSMEFSTGNGLSNLQERYKLLSGDELIIEQDEQYFTVRLKLLKR